MFAFDADLSCVRVQLIFTPAEPRKCDGNILPFRHLQAALCLLQGGGFCGLAAQRKLDAVLLLPCKVSAEVLYSPRFAQMSHYAGALRRGPAPTPLPRMMTLASPVPAVSSDG